MKTVFLADKLYCRPSSYMLCMCILIPKWLVKKINLIAYKNLIYLKISCKLKVYIITLKLPLR